MGSILGVFIVLHGLVHLLYFGQSAGYFQLKPGMVWPAGSRLFSGRLGDEAASNLASISLVLAAIGLVAAGTGILTSQAWWRPAVLSATALSSIVYIVFWNGTTQNLDGQGAVGLLINIAIIVVVLMLRWPP